MATFDYGNGEQEFRCTSYTTTVYEQEFRDDPNPKITGDLIADVMGVVKFSSRDAIEIEDDGTVTLNIDYTGDNWNAEKRAFWAMLRTEAIVRQDAGERYPNVPSYAEWDRSVASCEPDMNEFRTAVCNELQRGLFRAGAAASE